LQTEQEQLKSFRSPDIQHPDLSGGINEDELDAELDEYFEKSRSRRKMNSIELVESEAEDFYASSTTGSSLT
jgi:hypothetical protein